MIQRIADSSDSTTTLITAYSLQSPRRLVTSVFQRQKVDLCDSHVLISRYIDIAETETEIDIYKIHSFNIVSSNH